MHETSNFRKNEIKTNSEKETNQATAKCIESLSAPVVGLIRHILLVAVHDELGPERDGQLALQVPDHAVHEGGRDR
jgi:hypothetical protein